MQELAKDVAGEWLFYERRRSNEHDDHQDERPSEVHDSLRVDHSTKCSLEGKKRQFT